MHNREASIIVDIAVGRGKGESWEKMWTGKKEAA